MNAQVAAFPTSQLALPSRYIRNFPRSIKPRRSRALSVRQSARTYRAPTFRKQAGRSMWSYLWANRCSQPRRRLTRRDELAELAGYDIRGAGITQGTRLQGLCQPELFLPRNSFTQKANQQTFIPSSTCTRGPTPLRTPALELLYSQRDAIRPMHTCQIQSLPIVHLSSAALTPHFTHIAIVARRGASAVRAQDPTYGSPSRSPWSSCPPCPGA